MAGRKRTGERRRSAGLGGVADVCHVIPPYMTDSIARLGDPDQRARILETASITASLRAARLVRSEVAAAQRALFRGRGRRLLGGGPGTCTLDLTIFSAHNTYRIPGTRVRDENMPPTGDNAVDEAFDGIRATHAFYCAAYERDSVDGQGQPLKGVAHYGNRYDNAFWDGKEMIFGDGDGKIFNRFTVAVDVIGHELTHGVTEDEAGLIYWAQPGALNESISDVFGSLVKQYSHVPPQKADEADWLIGEGLLMPTVTGTALRSMKAPGTAYNDPVLGKDPQPARMADYVHGLGDNGGVHINSGIPNKAFYEVAVDLGGYAWESAGLIWYQTLRSPQLRRTANFQAFANLTVRTARRLFGRNSPEEHAVHHGWSVVGITV